MPFVSPRHREAIAPCPRSLAFRRVLRPPKPLLDGRVINNHFWLVYGALTNVGYTITVTDTVTGAVKIYTNPEGRLASQADTEAF